MRARITPSVIRGTVKAPQSKSIAIRLIFAGLLGDIRLEGLEASGDVVSAQNAISRVKDAIASGKSDCGMLDVGGSGTALRMLLPILSFLGLECEIHGDATLGRRPIGVLKGWMESNGAHLSSDHLPLRMWGKADPGTVEISGAESSQYISGMIYALLLSGGGRIKLIPPVRSSSYIVMTCSILNSLGCHVKYSGLEIDVVGDGAVPTYHGAVPGDFLLSSFYAAASVLTGGQTNITGLSQPDWSKGDSRIVGIMNSMGAGSRMEGDTWHVSAEGALKPFDEDVEDSPDMAVTLAALAAAAEGQSRIRGIQLLATKESDRIMSIRKTIESFGLKVSTNGKMNIVNQGNLHAGVVKDWKDHRIAMLGTSLALHTGGVVHGAESVSKSNPRFFDDIAILGGKLELGS